MFQEWGFLLGEIWILLILAALIGLLAGWIIWGRFSSTEGDTTSLQADLDACRKKHADKDAALADREAALSNAQSAMADKDARIIELEAGLKACEDSKADMAPAAAVAPPAPAAKPEGVDYDGDGVVEGNDEGVKPATLDTARGGKADDLKQIKGIGPKMEKLCNKLGFFHFDQIASWTADEVAWVDANLEGFKGRVTRDEWVSQAKLLAAGGETEFSKKVEKGGVYD